MPNYYTSSSTAIKPGNGLTKDTLFHFFRLLQKFTSLCKELESGNISEDAVISAFPPEDHPTLQYILKHVVPPESTLQEFAQSHIVDLPTFEFFEPKANDEAQPSVFVTHDGDLLLFCWIIHEWLKASGLDKVVLHFGYANTCDRDVHNAYSGGNWVVSSSLLQHWGSDLITFVPGNHALKPPSATN